MKTNLLPETAPSATGTLGKLRTPEWFRWDCNLLWLANLGNTYFFALAALIQLLIVSYASDVLGINDSQKTL